MNLSHLPELASGFVTLLLLPTLGVLGLMEKRAIPVLAWTLVGWAALGGLALWTHHTWQWSEARFLRGWLLGLALGAAFLLVAVLHANPRIKPWVRISLVLLTIAVFARSLLEFLKRYA